VQATWTKYRTSQDRTANNASGNVWRQIFRNDSNT